MPLHSLFKHCPLEYLALAHYSLPFSGVLCAETDGSVEESDEEEDDGSEEDTEMAESDDEEDDVDSEEGGETTESDGEIEAGLSGSQLCLADGTEFCLPLVANKAENFFIRDAYWPVIFRHAMEVFVAKFRSALKLSRGINIPTVLGP